MRERRRERREKDGVGLRDRSRCEPKKLWVSTIGDFGSGRLILQGTQTEGIMASSGPGFTET